MPLIYAELHRLAAYYMRNERAGHTLQTTAVVHEAYLHLIGQQAANWQSRAHFMAVAAQVMRHLLIDHARKRRAAKHGGLQQKVPLEQAFVTSDQQAEELIALEIALTRLAERDERQSRIVELRYFGGLSVQETAEVLTVSSKTVERDWTVARAWLQREVGGGKFS